MKSLIHLLLIVFISFSSMAFAGRATVTTQNDTTQQDVLVRDIYKRANLEGILDFQLFKDGYYAYYRTSNRQKQLLTIIDYSKPSTKKRFYVIDLSKNKLLFHTYVSHGVNTGGVKAKKFSNRVNSRQTSLGTFLTDKTYYGGNGYSLKLDGLTRGVNDNARRRYIVVHGADYSTEAFIKRHGYLGRSWGCPSVPKHLARPIIDTIKGGSVIYAHG